MAAVRTVTGIMEPAHIKEQSKFERERFRPFCLDPAKGLHHVFDSRGTDRIAEQFRGNYEVVAAECRRLNDLSFAEWRRRRHR